MGEFLTHGYPAPYGVKDEPLRPDYYSAYAAYGAESMLLRLLNSLLVNCYDRAMNLRIKPGAKLIEKGCVYFSEYHEGGVHPISERESELFGLIFDFEKY